MQPLFNNIFAALQKHFVVSHLSLVYGNYDNGHFDVPAMVKRESTPPQTAIMWDVYATVFELPWKVKDGEILSKQYRLSYTAQHLKQDEVVRGLMDWYRKLKAGESEARRLLEPYVKQSAP